MKDAIRWIDQPFASKDRILLVQDQLSIPGLVMFGKHTMHHATPPLPFHYHEDCFEITYISKGVLTFSTQATDYRLNGGDVFITAPNEIHSTNLTPISVGEIYWFQLNTTDISEFLYLSQAASQSMASRLKNIFANQIKTDTKEMRSYLERFFKLALSGENPYLAASCLCMFLHLLLDYSKQSAGSLTKDIEQSIKYITSHITEEISLEQLAAVSCLSTSQFKQKFKAQTGTSPRNYINYQKIELAQSLLLSNHSITQTAMDLAFNSSSYFAVVFKRYAACTPSEYLQQTRCTGKPAHLS